MGKIFKNLIPYWKSVIVIILLLVIQAWCDLSLPQYTSDIIDTGIQNGGIEHVVPEAMTSEEFEKVQIFMTEDEITEWRNTYTKDEDIYRRKDFSKEELEELDDKFIVPLLLNYQASSSGTDPALLARMPKGQVREMRKQVEDTMETMGDSMVSSMGIAYAKQCNEDAGLDMDQIQKEYLILSGAKMLLIALLAAVVAILVSLIASRVGAGIGKNLRGQVFHNVVNFSNAEMDRFSTASLITRSTNDVQQVQMVSTLFLRMLVYAPILGIGGIIKVANTGAGMGWVIVLAVILIFAMVMLLMALAMPKFKLMQKLVDKVNLVSREILTGLPVIRAFSREKKEEERFDDANKELTKTMLFTNRTMTFMMPGMMFIMNGLTVLIIWVAAHKIDEGTMQVGAMTAFITYAMMIVMSFLMLTMMSVMLPRAAVAAGRIDEVIRTKSDIVDKEQTQSPAEKKGVLKFDHVSFCYDGAERNVLEDIDFTAEPGKTTAIIGSTGCGKSTLVNLIPRLYDVTEGKITLDGIDIRDMAQSELRAEIGLVPQKAMLFSGTIETNLKFGRPEASDEDMKEAAEIAQAVEFIEEKNRKYDSEIAQGGANVSGGQKQRLSIARAIVKNPKVYIFDDSFSALDVKTEAILRKALGEKTKDSTVLIVAQRISTILHAEQIIVLEDGRMAGIGTHEELLKNCDVYRQIAVSQMSKEELGIEDSGKEDGSDEQ